MSELGDIKTCHVCHDAIASSDNVECEACRIDLSPETHQGHWDSPGPTDKPLNQAENRQHQLTEENLSRHTNTLQSRIEVARNQRRKEVRASYHKTLRDQQVIHGQTREQALKHARDMHEEDEILAEVAASEEAGYHKGVREDVRCRLALNYRQQIRNRMEKNRESRDKAVAAVRQEMADEADISVVAFSEEVEYQGDISNNLETLLDAYTRCVRNYSLANRHTREESLEWGRQQYGHHANFAEIVGQEEEEYQSYLRDEERMEFAEEYDVQLWKRMYQDDMTRDQALAWLQQKFGDHPDFVEVARNEVGDYEDRCRIENRRRPDSDSDDDDDDSDSHSDDKDGAEE